MIITVRGVKGHDNGATALAGSLATLSAVNKNSKTLCLQLVGTSETNLEHVMLGRKLEGPAGLGDTAVADSSTDELLRLVESGTKITQSDIDDLAFTVFLKHKNLLDIIKPSAQNDVFAAFSKETKQEKLENLLTSCSGAYDNVVVLLSHDVNDDVLLMEQLADKNIVCLKQGCEYSVKKDIPELQENEKTRKAMAVIPEYDPASKFHKKILRKMYKTDAIFTVEHSTGYYDACVEGNLVDFVRHNRRAEESDINYDWIMDMYELLDKLLLTEDVEESSAYPTLKGSEV